MADAHGGHGDAHEGGHDPHVGAGEHVGGYGGGSVGRGLSAMLGTKYTDDLYDYVATIVSEQVSTFVAFIFVLITVGAIYGALVAARNPALEPFLVIVPAILGLISFYNRDIATLFFILFVAAFIII